MTARVAAQSVRIEQKDGLTLVRNGSKPAVVPGAPKGVRLVPELTIGSENDTDETMIFSIRSVQVGAGGEIFVLDDKIDQIKVYGPDGRHLRTIGKKGQGPGELQSPTRMAMTADGNLCIPDAGNNRVSFFSPEGTCLKETPFKGWRPIRFLPDSRGGGYGDFLDLQGGVKDILVEVRLEARQGRHDRDPCHRGESERPDEPDGDVPLGLSGRSEGPHRLGFLGRL